MPPLFLAAEYRNRTYTIKHRYGQNVANVFIIHACASGRSVLTAFTLPVANCRGERRGDDLARRVRRLIDNHADLIGD